MIKKKIKPTEIQNVAWDELQKGGPRSGGSKLDWNLKTQTKKQTDAWEEKQKKKKKKKLSTAGRNIVLRVKKKPTKKVVKRKPTRTPRKPYG